MSDAPVTRDEKTPARARAFPWATVEIAGLACLIFWSRTTDSFIYDRGLILHGQVWRAWTGHLAHFGLSHLFWNLSVFIPAGCWLERIHPCAARWFYAWCPPVITGVLLVFDPTLLRYAGLSGVATGLLVLLAALQLQRGSREPRWFWIGVLILVAIKMTLELVTHRPLLVSDFHHIRDVPLAHVGGAACALAAWAAMRRQPPACHP